MTATTNIPILDMFDFDGQAALEPQNLPPMPRPDDRGVLSKIEIAAQMGDLPTIRNLWQELKGLPEASCWTEDQRALSTALLLAVENRRRHITEFLLEQGVQRSEETGTCWSFSWSTAGTSTRRKTGAWALSYDPNGKAVLDKTPLSEAVRFAPFPTIKLMFDHGGSVNVGQLLHCAVHRTHLDTLEVLDFLLQRGATINKIMYEDSPPSYAAEIASGLGTPLHEAASKGDLQATRFLIERGAHPLIEDSLGGTPLQKAEKAGHVDVVAYLRPITVASPPTEHQFTRGRRVPGWERYYVTVRSDERL